MLSGGLATSVTGVVSNGSGNGGLDGRGGRMGLADNQKQPPLGNNNGKNPQDWWQYFVTHDYSRLQQIKPPLEMLGRLAQGIEQFRAEEHRKDTCTLKIWLGYLHCHWECYGDEEEVRRLFKFLKTERVGGGEAAVELVLHYAHFEMSMGRREKCGAILESAAATGTTLTSNSEQLRKAMVEYRLLGSFRLPPLIPSSFSPESIGNNASCDFNMPRPIPQANNNPTVAQVPPFLEQGHSNGAIAGNSFSGSGSGLSSSFQAAPPPTPLSPVPLVHTTSALATPVANIVAMGPPAPGAPLPMAASSLDHRRSHHHHQYGTNSRIRHHNQSYNHTVDNIPVASLIAAAGGVTSAVPSSDVKATEEQRAALSLRVRRLGLGPPKRAILPGGGGVGGITTPSPDSPLVATEGENSPNDSTVPRGLTGPSPLPRMEDVGSVGDRRLADNDFAPRSPTRSTSNLMNYHNHHGTSSNNGNHAHFSMMDEDDETETVTLTRRKDGLRTIDEMSLTTVSPTTQRSMGVGTGSNTTKRKGFINTNTFNGNIFANHINSTSTTAAVAAVPPSIHDNGTTSGSIPKPKVVKINGKPYRVLSLIGKGGSSRVFKVLSGGEHPTIYALKKVNLRNLDEATIGGYINEINLLLSLRDAPHIIRLVDQEVSREHGFIYMVMEYGEIDLSKLLRAKAAVPGGIDANFVRYIWQQMLRAVQTVHAAKIVHCDLKPANFLLVAGTLKLIDFGISKAIVTNDTTNIVRENQVGTVNYMSPEALQESNNNNNSNNNSGAGHAMTGRIKIGRASDIWSLGCILYEMVYGRPPFAQFSLIQRLQKILDPTHEIDFSPLPPALQEPSLMDVMRTCLVRAAKRRPSLEELLYHPFLLPVTGQVSFAVGIPPDALVVSKQQLGELIHLFAKHIPNLDPVALTERVFNQWKAHQR